MLFLFSSVYVRRGIIIEYFKKMYYHIVHIDHKICFITFTKEYDRNGIQTNRMMCK